MIAMSEKILVGLYDEIVKIRQLLEIIARENLGKELENILTTRERKMVWALSDGLTDTKTIAERAEVSQRAVQITLKGLQNAGFLTVERRGFPKRRFDYIVSYPDSNKEGEGT
jgi:DNA-binding transcriptional ArsR family regulator